MVNCCLPCQGSFSLVFYNGLSEFYNNKSEEAKSWTGVEKCTQPMHIFSEKLNRKLCDKSAKVIWIPSIYFKTIMDSKSENNSHGYMYIECNV